MSRRKRTAATGVSLFPFLDVLICTMGSLILLLIVVTKKVQPAIAEKARQAAITAKKDMTEADAAVTTPAHEAMIPESDESKPDDSALHEWRTQIESLAAERDSKQSQLTKLERKLLAAQAAMLLSQEQAASKQEQLQSVRVTQQKSMTERKRLQADIMAAREELSAAEQRLADAKEQQKTARSKFAFVPFDGRTGTTRRPILIECTDQFIRFVPEDVRLTAEELNGFTMGFNPLLNASRELVHFWDVYDRVHAAENETEPEAKTTEDLLSHERTGKEPYVLLLVRPSGAMSFLIAKNLLAKLKIPHGYELLDDGMELEFSDPNPEARKICQQAIEQTLGEREKVMQLVAGNRTLQSDQLKLDPNSHSFAPVEEGDSSRPFGTRTSSGGAASNVPTTSATGTSRDRDSGAGSFVPNSNGMSAGGEKRTGLTGNRVDGVTTRQADDDRTKSTGRRSESEFLSRTGDESSAMNSPQQSSKKNGVLGPGSRLAGNDLGSEPPEEALPRSASSRSDDDTKPFPFGRTNRGGTASGAVNLQSQAASGAGSREVGKTTTSDARPSGSATADRPMPGQRPAGNGDIRQHKKRYAMSRPGIGLEKAIPIRVWSNRILVGEEFEIPVDANVRTESLVNRVLMGLDQVQASWPSAGVGYHWVPTIRYEVVPGGDQVQERLNSALFDLGLVSTVTFLDADPDALSKPKNTSTPKKPVPTNGSQSAPQREPSRVRAAVSMGTRTPIGGER